MQLVVQFLGRLHPLLVHLPIGILVLAFIFELLSLFSPYRKLRSAIQPAIMLGAMSALAAVASGYLLSQEGGYEDDLLDLHRNAGIATAIFSVVFYFLRKKAILHFGHKGKRKMASILLFTLLIVLLSFTGHLGGSLTHGTDYLFDLGEAEQSTGPTFAFASSAAIDSAIFYDDIIEPILKSRCYSCHSSKKQKGQLRLDNMEAITRGGKHGSVIVSGIPDSSALYQRLMLPLEDEDHMPPNEKGQPSSAEIALVQSWIDAGASFDKPVWGYPQPGKVKTYLSTLLSTSPLGAVIPKDPVSPAPQEAIRALAAIGVLTIPVGSGSNYLSVSFINARSATDDELKLLLPVRQQLLWLDLGRTSISDDGLKTVGELDHVTRLNLNYTNIDGRGLQHLASLGSLTYLNLVGTKVNDEGLRHLGSLRSLEKIFLYRTDVTRMGTTHLLDVLPGIALDTGDVQLPPPAL